MDPLAIVAAILTTLAEIDRPAPAGVCFAALQSRGVSLDTFQMVRTAMVKAGLIHEAGGAHTITITEEGRKKAEEIESMLKKNAER